MNKAVVPLHVAFRNCRRSSYRGSTVPESTRQKEISIRYNTIVDFILSTIRRLMLREREDSICRVELKN